MSLNCNEINKILSELDIENSFIQDIIQPGFDSLALYTYKPSTAKTVFICTAQNSCRINETRKKIPKNEKPLRFMELLKSKIRGGKITKIFQIGFERIIKIEIAVQQINYFLYIRLWSNAGNVILTDSSNIIIDSMFRRPNKNEITGKEFFIEEIPDYDLNLIEKKFTVRDFLELEEDYNKTQNAQYKKFSDLSFNEKVEIFYTEHATSLSRKALLEKCEKWYTQHNTKLTNALEKLLKKKSDFSLADKKKHQGDLIMSYSHLIKENDTTLECLDYETNNTIIITLDPKKNAYQNAQFYYDSYKKEISGLEQLEEDIKLTKNKLERLEKEYNAILQEPNPVKIEQMLRKDTKPKQQEKKLRPGLMYLVDGWTIFVGRDANENDELLRHHVKGQDMWFHTRDYPGGYVFVKNQNGKTIPLDIMLDASNLAIYFSKARKAQKADLYYTQVKYLRRAKNGPKGLVLPTQEKNINVQLDNARLNRLNQLHEQQLGI